MKKEEDIEKEKIYTGIYIRMIIINEDEDEDEGESYI